MADRIVSHPCKERQELCGVSHSRSQAKLTFREPNTTEDEDGFYTTASYAKHMIETLENRSEEDRSKPFFGYLAFSAPHWPLQAPKRKTQK